MEDQTDIPADDGGTGPGFGMGDRVLAGVLLVGASLLAYVCLDVLAGGRITRALSAPPEIGES